MRFPIILRGSAAATALIVLGCFGCNDGAIETTNIEEGPRTECTAEDALCKEVVRRQAMALRAYSESNAEKVSYLNQKAQRHRERLESNSAACEAGKSAFFCDLAEQSQLQIQQVEMRIALVSMQEKSTVQRLQTVQDRLGGLLEAAIALPDLLCDIKDTGRVDCVTLGLLIATYDSEIQEVILSDIGRLFDVFDIARESEILMACRPGTWGGAMLADLGIAEIAELPASLDGDFVQAMGEMCLDIEGGIGSQSDAIGSAGGFSGITGFDPFGMNDFCGMDTTGGGSFDSAMEQFSKMLDAQSDYCETSLAESMMSGGADDPKPDDPKPEDPKPEDPKPEDPAPEKELESKTEKVVPNPDGTTNKTTTYIYKDGSKYVTSNTYDQDGNLMHGVQIGKQTDGTRVTTWTTVNPDGSRDHAQLSRDSDGSTSYVRWTTDSSGNRSNWYQGDCLDEPCNVCNDTAAAALDAMHECTASGGASYTCQAFGRATDCCSDSNAFPADPRLVMPDPNGDYICTSGADLDLKAGACEMQCSVASNQEDCTSLCMDDRSFTFNFSLLDTICPYAIHDGCYSGSLPPYDGPIDPLPLPVEHGALLPELLRDRIAVEGPRMSGSDIDRWTNPSHTEPP